MEKTIEERWDALREKMHVINKLMKPWFNHIDACSSCHAVDDDRDWVMCPTGQRIWDEGQAEIAKLPKEK